MLRRLTSRSLTMSLIVIGATAATAATAEPVRAHVDDFALRYYSSLDQKDRVEAEEKRLLALDPEWRAPEDLGEAKAGRADEAPLWDLYARNQIDAIEAAISQRRAEQPGWEPSADLQAKIKAKHLRATIIGLAKEQKWHAVVQSFKANGIGWAADDAEILWVIAEAYAREDDCGEAYVVYHSIMVGHSDPNERRATIERAIAMIPMAMVEKLIALGQTDTAGHNEFDPIAIDITRARLSAFLHDEPSNAVGDDELKRFEDGEHDAVDPNEAGLIAWYAFKRHDYPLALDWFKMAIAHGGDAMIAHGLAHTLRNSGMKREAEEVAYAWREPLVNNSILYTDLLEEDLTKESPPYIEPARIERYAEVTMATESGEGAQALAWYAYNTCQYPLALQWFERGVAWLPKEATVYGYALALQHLHRQADFRRVVNRYDGLFPKVVALAFDDGRRRPPPACESDRSEPSATPISTSDASTTGESPTADWTGRTMADTLRQKITVARASDVSRASYRRARVPSPDDASGSTDRSVPALVKKAEFPVAVGPENPLRFSATKSNSNQDSDATFRGHVGPGPLVARRVPGVGPMPYERYGFTLYPGYDGTKDASSPTSAERAAPTGTLWALEQSLRSSATVERSQRQSVDTTSRSPAAADASADIPPSPIRF